jgi:hypothetical protein
MQQPNTIVLTHNCFVQAPSLLRELDLSKIVLVHITESYVTFYSGEIFILPVPSAEHVDAYNEYKTLVSYLVDCLSEDKHWLAVYQPDDPKDLDDDQWYNEHDEECRLNFYGGPNNDNFVDCNARTTDIRMYDQEELVFGFYSEHNDKKQFVLLNTSSINEYSHDPGCATIHAVIDGRYNISIYDAFSSYNQRVKMDVLDYFFARV